MLLTGRDLLVLQFVAEYRFLTRDQIQRLAFGNLAESVCKRRLTLLFHHGILGRLYLPVPSAFGAARAVYYVDAAGARTLREHHLAEMAVWRKRDAERETLFLDHTLDINDVRIAAFTAARDHGLDLNWVEERTLRRDGALARVRGRDGQQVVLLPDACFTLGRGAEADAFALEVDRATVSERRMRARMRAYGEWAASGAHRRRLQSDSFRVIFAVTDEKRDAKRLQRLKEWCEDERGGSLFWFVDREGLGADILSEPVWLVAGRDDRVKLTLSGP
jgi:hypothetical protein